jgi:thiamine-phosphate pyrophosphorylase
MANYAEHLRLVAITDNLRDGIDGLRARAQGAQRGGATMIQVRLRAESARTLTSLTRALVSALEIPVVVHGRIDVALAAGAHGVHLGVHDLSVQDVRRVVGEEFIIGRSAATVGDLTLATGADYVTLGPIFAPAARRPSSSLGISNFETMVQSARVPVVAIGGITVASAADVMRAGATGVALISGILGVSDPEGAARGLRSAIGT